MQTVGEIIKNTRCLHWLISKLTSLHGILPYRRIPPPTPGGAVPSCVTRKRKKQGSKLNLASTPRLYILFTDIDPRSNFKSHCRFQKSIRYQSRKARADERRRVKGRFVKAGDTYDYDPLTPPHGSICWTAQEYWEVCKLDSRYVHRRRNKIHF